MSLTMGYISTPRRLGRSWDVSLRWNLRNWGIGFGAACWEDPEIGDYGQRYGCDYYWGFIVRLLCFSVEFTCLSD